MIRNIHKYTLTPQKGSLGEVNVAMFDKIRPCIGERCAIAPKCPYLKGKLKEGRTIPEVAPEFEHLRDKHGRSFDPGIHQVDDDGDPLVDKRNGMLKIRLGQPPLAMFVYGDCMYERKYMEANTKPFLDLVEKVQDAFLMQWVGMHLVPLYHNLAVLQMEMLRVLDVEKVTYEDNSGRMSSHPIFEELRKAHKAIFDVWRVTGLLKLAEKAGFLKADGNLPKPAGSTNEEKEVSGDGDFVDSLSKD